MALCILHRMVGARRACTHADQHNTQWYSYSSQHIIVDHLEAAEMMLHTSICGKVFFFLHCYRYDILRTVARSMAEYTVWCLFFLFSPFWLKKKNKSRLLLEMLRVCVCVFLEDDARRRIWLTHKMQKLLKWLIYWRGWRWNREKNIWLID